MLYRLHHELDLPIYCVLDNDPWGYYIYSVLKQGSINLAYESKRMAIPAVRYLGLRSNDYDRCELSTSVQIKLNEQDIKRAQQIKSYPWFEHKKAWQKEIDLMPYHARFGHANDVAWISRQTEQLGKLLDVRGEAKEKPQIWPIVQLADWGERVSVDQIATVIEHATRRPSTGVMVFHWSGVSKEPEKIAALERAYRSLE